MSRTLIKYEQIANLVEEEKKQQADDLLVFLQSKPILDIPRQQRRLKCLSFRESGVLTNEQRMLLQDFSAKIQSILDHNQTSTVEKEVRLKEQYMNPITGKLGQPVSSKRLRDCWVSAKEMDRDLEDQGHSLKLL